MNTEINPDNAMLRQSDGMWQKYALLILFKLTGGKAVNITVDDMKAMQAAFDDTPCMCIHGHADSIGFSIVTEERARELAAWDAARSGNA